MKSVTQRQGTANEAMGGPYLAFEQDHWADKPSSAPGHLAAVDEVLQLAHLHGALEPNIQAEEAGQPDLQMGTHAGDAKMPTHVKTLWDSVFERSSHYIAKVDLEFTM